MNTSLASQRLTLTQIRNLALCYAAGIFIFFAMVEMAFFVPTVSLLAKVVSVLCRILIDIGSVGLLSLCLFFIYEGKVVGLNAEPTSLWLQRLQFALCGYIGVEVYGNGFAIEGALIVLSVIAYLCSQIELRARTSDSGSDDTQLPN